MHTWWPVLSLTVGAVVMAAYVLIELYGLGTVRRGVKVGLEKKRAKDVFVVGRKAANLW